MPCQPICNRETVSQDPEKSPGVVSSDELIHRAIYPSNRSATGIRRGAIAASHLWGGQLSVWSLGPVVTLELSDLVELLDPLMIRSNGERFDQIRSALTGTIRAYQINDQRGFSVVDECDLDEVGTKHRAHAHIAICERLKATITQGDDTFLGLQEWLKLLFEGAAPIWQRA
jgi:hypothetical protein